MPNLNWNDDIHEEVLLAAPAVNLDILKCPSGRAGIAVCPAGAAAGDTINCHISGYITVPTAQATPYADNAVVRYDLTNKVAVPVGTALSVTVIHLGIPRKPKAANVGTTVEVLINVRPLA
jgi:hypothetical protein